MKSRVGKLVFSAFVVLMALPVNGATPLASFKSTILLNADSSAVVIESMRPVKPGFVERRLRVRSASLIRDRLWVDILDVTNDLGRPLGYHARLRGDYLIVEMAVSGEVKLTYAIRNAIRFTGNHDEFLWPATPAENGVNAAEVTLMLPAAAGQFTAQSVLRRDAPGMPAAVLWSSDGRLPTTVTSSGIETGAPGPLPAGVMLTVDVVTEKGVFTPPAFFLRAWWFLENNPIVLMPLAAWLLMLLVRRVKGRNADPGRSVAPMYAPPEGVTPAEAGTLIDDSLDARDIAATLVDLAVRGFLRIEECAPQEGLVVDRRDFILRLAKPRAEWPPLALHEETMLFHTFYGGQWTKLSSLHLRFPEIVPMMRKQILNELRDKGMYRIDPVQAQKWRQAAVWVVAGGLLLLQQFGLFSLFDSPWLGLAMVLLSAGIVFLLGRNMTSKTLQGMRVYVALRGLEEFIDTVEGDRLQRMDQAALERLLPYAMALGIEHRWAHIFHGIATTAPDWFAWADGHIFDAVVFGNSMGRLSTAVATAPLRRGPRGRKATVAAEAAPTDAARSAGA